MYKIILNTLYKKCKENLLAILISSVALAFMFWLQISPFSFNDYNRICKANYSTVEQFNECLKPYWDQYRIDKPLLIIALGSSSISLVFLLVKLLI